MNSMPMLLLLNVVIGVTAGDGRPLDSFDSTSSTMLASSSSRSSKSTTHANIATAPTIRVGELMAKKYTLPVYSTNHSSSLSYFAMVLSPNTSEWAQEQAAKIVVYKRRNYSFLCEQSVAVTNPEQPVAIAISNQGYVCAATNNKSGFILQRQKLTDNALKSVKKSFQLPGKKIAADSIQCGINSTDLLVRDRRNGLLFVDFGKDTIINALEMEKGKQTHQASFDATGTGAWFCNYGYDQQVKPVCSVVGHCDRRSRKITGFWRFESNAAASFSVNSDDTYVAILKDDSTVSLFDVRKIGHDSPLATISRKPGYTIGAATFYGNTLLYNTHKIYKPFTQLFLTVSVSSLSSLFLPSSLEDSPMTVLPDNDVTRLKLHDNTGIFVEEFPYAYYDGDYRYEKREQSMRIFDFGPK